MSFFDSLLRAKDKIEAKIEEQLHIFQSDSSSHQEGGDGGPPPIPPRPAHLFPQYAQPGPPQQSFGGGGQYMNAVYYPSWAIYKDKTPGTLDVSSVTHVYYAFIGVNEDGSLRHFDEWADLNKDVDGEKGCLAALAKLKSENPHIKTVLSVGGGTGSKEFPALAASEDARRRFADEARQFCDRHSFDGIDIDWEHPQDEEQGYHFLKLLEACRETLPSPTYLLTTALPVGEWVLRHLDLARVSHVIDYINLMAYDYTGAWTQSCGHQAQLHVPPSVHPELGHCGSKAIDYILSRGFQARQLVLGVPNYARFFPRARGHGDRFEGAGEMEYCDIPDEWVERAYVDDRAVAAWHMDHDEKGFVSFDVPATVQMKASFVAGMGLGGLFYWTWTGDKQGPLSLVAAGRYALGS
ncbi:Chitinase 1 [Escovopsis weberi]|uniref:chitinase n=1 Tax=Escovopsis weberi TaxID=150374 RepID=A0A0M9VVB7_ESCWE|nr:Chitinase 1 [Escovopsis weberi]